MSDRAELWFIRWLTGLLVLSACGLLFGCAMSAISGDWAFDIAVGIGLVLFGPLIYWTARRA